MSSEYDFRRGFVVYPDAKPEEPAAKAPYVDHGTALIPPSRYYSTEEAALEWDRMWTKVWCFAGLAHDLEEVGDYFRYDLGTESFIVVRSGPDRVQAFYNVCPHRGNPLVYKDYGHLGKNDSFYCNFHGWRFNADGSVKHLRDAEHGIFRPETICDLKGLPEVRCEIWNSLVFINMDPRAMPLEQYLDVIPEHLKHYSFDRMRVYSELQGVVDANWKTGMEAFLEFYHGDDVHPQVLPITATLKTQYDLYRNGMSRMIIRVGYSGDRCEDPDVVNDGVKMFVSFFGGNNDDYKHLKGGEYDKALCDTLRKWAARNGHQDMFDRLTDGQVTDDWNYHVFPTITLNVFSWGLLVQSWTPYRDDPGRHVYRALSLMLPVSDPDQAVMDPASFAVEARKGWKGEVRPKRVVPQKAADWGTVLSQDIERIPSIQQGLRSRSYEGHRLCESESRLRHYLAEIDRYVGR